MYQSKPPERGFVNRKGPNMAMCVVLERCNWGTAFRKRFPRTFLACIPAGAGASQPCPPPTTDHRITHRIRERAECGLQALRACHHALSSRGASPQLKLVAIRLTAASLPQVNGLRISYYLPKLDSTTSTMSYNFTIFSPTDTPLFTHEFGTSRSGGDGIARFTTSERALNPFVLHSALDIVEEVQWGPSTSSGSAPMYLKHIDKYQNNFISCWVTGANVRFLLLTRPRDEALGLGSGGTGGSQRGSLAGGRSALGGGAGLYSPTNPATEEAVKNFFVDVYEAWVKTIMNPFFNAGNGDVVKSPVFRQRVVAAAKKYL